MYSLKIIHASTRRAEIKCTAVQSAACNTTKCTGVRSFLSLRARVQELFVLNSGKSLNLEEPVETVCSNLPTRYLKPLVNFSLKLILYIALTQKLLRSLQNVCSSIPNKTLTVAPKAHDVVGEGRPTHAENRQCPLRISVLSGISLLGRRSSPQRTSEGTALPLRCLHLQKKITIAPKAELSGTRELLVPI